MKKLFMNSGAILLTVIFLIACTGKTSDTASESANKAEEAPKKKELTLKDKARNTFVNTTVIFAGTMFMTFSENFKGQAESFTEAFGAEMNDEAINEIDAKIAGMNDETLVKLEEMVDEMNRTFDSISEANVTIYDKIFMHDMMKEGVAIHENHQLPDGFPPVSQDLSKEELKRYIIKMTADGQKEDDPIVQYFSEIIVWFQAVSTELEKDEEISAFMASMK